MADTAWTPYHTKLTEELSQRLWEKESAQVIAIEAGINPALVTFSDNATNNWHEIVRQAEAQGVLVPLIEVAIRHFPTSETLKQLYDFLIIPRSKAITAIQQYDLSTLSNIVDDLKRRVPNAPETWYFTYRLQFMRLETKEALDSLNHLLQLPFSDNALPVKNDQLRDIQVTLRYWFAALKLPPSDPPPPIQVTMFTGNDVDHLSEAPKTKLFVEGVDNELPQIEYGKLAQFVVLNKDSNPAYIYFVKTMADGQIHDGALLQASESSNGLEANMYGKGPAFPAEDSPSVIETRIFYSPKRIDKMLPAVTPGVRKLESAWISEKDVEAVKMIRCWFQVISSI